MQISCEQIIGLLGRTISDADVLAVFAKHGVQPPDLALPTKKDAVTSFAFADSRVQVWLKNGILGSVLFKVNAKSGWGEWVQLSSSPYYLVLPMGIVSGDGPEDVQKKFGITPSWCGWVPGRTSKHPKEYWVDYESEPLKLMFIFDVQMGICHLRVFHRSAVG